MVYMTHFFGAWMQFIAPMSVLDIKTNYKQKLMFTTLLGSITIVARNIYRWISLPFGVHTMIFALTAVLLMKKIVPELSWMKTIFIIWMNMLVVTIVEILILFPITLYFGVTMRQVESNPLLICLFSGLGSNMGLIIAWGIGKHRNRLKQSVSLGKRM
ncbi:hypothetical protein QBE52_17775 [Clostridiaceae bacterium 35-E11]